MNVEWRGRCHPRLESMEILDINSFQLAQEFVEIQT